ncbi:hypothetical protein H4CHR_04412 [Variovorax sp. PBS-H4]|nr:hypothetical protein H4CHR_04412 [Variovorax sp. PBS-H4]
MTTQLLPRPVALAKLLEHGPMRHTEAVLCCGWGWEGFRHVAHQALEAKLVTFANIGGTRVYRAGPSKRRRGPQSWL